MANKPIIPPWQRASAVSASSTPIEPKPQARPDEKSEQSTAPAVEAPTPTESDLDARDSEELLEQASRFLDDASIRDAPREKKVAFLESKGVSVEDIETLLGAKTEEIASSELEEAGERAWSTAPPRPIKVQPPPPQSREIAPIVTYPEFLAQTEKPPPLITTKRLLGTAYGAGGLMATLYGFSKYIVAPMTDHLTESRHDFATHAQEQLQEFNKRLVDVVSEDPATKGKSKTTNYADDVSEADSDPTELFHRDFGTQTTPTLSRRPSVTTSTDPEPTVTAHENRLKIIRSHLQELEATRSNDSASADSLKTKVSDLATYLSEMSYQNQYYSNSFYGASYGLPGGKDGKNDEIEVLKNDIRAVKGVFLSARNFPAGGRNTPSMPTGKVGA